MMEVPVMICPLKLRAQSNYNGCHTSILCGWWYWLGGVRIALCVVGQYDCMLLTVRGLLEKYPTFGREKETGLLGALDT